LTKGLISLLKLFLISSVDARGIGVVVCVGVTVRVRVGVFRWVLVWVRVRVMPGVNVEIAVGIGFAHVERIIATIIIEVRTTNNFFVISSSFRVKKNDATFYVWSRPFNPSIFPALVRGERRPTV
jgi:hypothetical protein